jgi:AcrR family transcriptional regulator
MATQRTSPRAEQTRERVRNDIIEAAFLEFSERGYHQTGIADIARRLGMGHGTFYRYFKNKRDIFDHVVQDVAVRLSSLLSEQDAPGAVDTLDGYRAQCQRIAQRFVAFVHDNPRVMRLLMLEATSVDAALTARMLKILTVSGIVTAAYMQNGVTRGFFREDLDVQATAKVVVAVIMGGLMQHLAAPHDEAGMQRYMDAGIEMLVRGMGRVA